MNLNKMKYWGGCGVSMAPQPVYSYPPGHPCYGCPYTFPTNKPSCTMGGTPGNCPWYFYIKIIASNKRKDNK